MDRLPADPEKLGIILNKLREKEFRWACELLVIDHPTFEGDVKELILTVHELMAIDDKFNNVCNDPTILAEIAQLEKERNFLTRRVDHFNGILPAAGAGKPNIEIALAHHQEKLANVEKRLHKLQHVEHDELTARQELLRENVRALYKSLSPICMDAGVGLQKIIPEVKRYIA